MKIMIKTATTEVKLMDCFMNADQDTDCGYLTIYLSFNLSQYMAGLMAVYQVDEIYSNPKISKRLQVQTAPQAYCEDEYYLLEGVVEIFEDLEKDIADLDEVKTVIYSKK